MTIARIVLLSLAAVGSWWLTSLIRRYAIRHALLDVPNERSSHTTPTPRGGGLAIVAVTLLGMLIAWLAGWIEARLAIAFLGGGAAVAFIGWQDDRRGVSRRVRAAIHLAAACWCVAWLGAPTSLDVGFGTLPLGPLGVPLVAISTVWLINLYNFMDGIDGIAAGEAVSVAAAAALITVVGGQSAIALVAALLAAASLGFLARNWAPASIFMGDAGSGFLGIGFATLALASDRAGTLPLAGWWMLLAVFAFDATITLLRRAAHGEQWYSAHRSHAYQRAVRSGLTHARVSAAVILVNVVLAALTVVTFSGDDATAAIAALTHLLLIVSLYLWVERRLPMDTHPHPAIPNTSASRLPRAS